MAYVFFLEHSHGYFIHFIPFICFLVFLLFGAFHLSEAVMKMESFQSLDIPGELCKS